MQMADVKAHGGAAREYDTRIHPAHDELLNSWENGRSFWALTDFHKVFLLR